MSGRFKAVDPKPCGLEKVIKHQNIPANQFAAGTTFEVQVMLCI